jgi:hypothetical protein
MIKNIKREQINLFAYLKNKKPPIVHGRLSNNSI